MANGIFNLFSNSPRTTGNSDNGQGNQGSVTPQPGQQSTQPQEPAFQQSSNQDPKNQQQPKNSEQPVDPATSGLDQFADLFKNEPKKDENGNIIKDEGPKDYFNYDPEKLRESVSRMNFTDSENFRELSTKALQGDAEAFGQVMNAVAQSVYSKAVEVSSAVANRAAKGSYEHTLKDLPNHVRSNLADDSLRGINPKFHDPALRTMVDSVRSQVESKYPNASPAEIAKTTNEYLTEAAKAFGTPTPDPTDRPINSDNDQEQQWDTFFGMPAQNS